MILRLTALLLLIYAVGFVLFGVTLADPAGSERTDAVVVLTGGSRRIERGVAVMDDRLAKRMLISGADPSFTRADLVRRLGPDSRRTVRCCVDLESVSVDTRSNAEEAQRWLDKRGYRSIRLITSDWHMRRAKYDFRVHLGPDYRIVEDAIRTRPSFATLFLEYNKYLLRRGSVWFDL